MFLCVLFVLSNNANCYKFVIINIEISKVLDNYGTHILGCIHSQNTVEELGVWLG